MAHPQDWRQLEPGVGAHMHPGAAPQAGAAPPQPQQDWRQLEPGVMAPHGQQNPPPAVDPLATVPHGVRHDRPLGMAADTPPPPPFPPPPPLAPGPHGAEPHYGQRPPPNGENVGSPQDHQPRWQEQPPQQPVGGSPSYQAPPAGQAQQGQMAGGVGYKYQPPAEGYQPPPQQQQPPQGPGHEGVGYRPGLAAPEYAPPPQPVPPQPQYPLPHDVPPQHVQPPLPPQGKALGGVAAPFRLPTGLNVAYANTLFEVYYEKYAKVPRMPLGDRVQAFHAASKAFLTQCDVVALSEFPTDRREGEQWLRTDLWKKHGVITDRYRPRSSNCDTIVLAYRQDTVTPVDELCVMEFDTPTPTTKRIVAQTFQYLRTAAFFTVIATHVPFSKDAKEIQSYLDAIAKVARAATNPIILGDFNLRRSQEGKSLDGVFTQKGYKHLSDGLTTTCVTASGDFEQLDYAFAYMGTPHSHLSTQSFPTDPKELIKHTPVDATRMGPPFSKAYFSDHSTLVVSYEMGHEPRIQKPKLLPLSTRAGMGGGGGGRGYPPAGGVAQYGGGGGRNAGYPQGAAGGGGGGGHFGGGGGGRHQQPPAPAPGAGAAGAYNGPKMYVAQGAGVVMKGWKCFCGAFQTGSKCSGCGRVKGAKF